MTFLSLLLAFKISVSVMLLCIPLLFLGKRILDNIFDLEDSSIVFYRLYGVAILALVAAYVGGFVAATAGRFPNEIVYMGVVSNLGSFTVMAVTGYIRRRPLTATLFGLIGVGFVVAAFIPDFAMAILW